MVGDNIKELRRVLGLTQQRFSARIGITQGTIAAIESNKRNISRQTLMSISREFGVRIEWLDTGEGEIFIEHDMSILEQLAAEYNLDEKSRELIENFLKLPPDIREQVATAVANAAKYYPRREEVSKPDSELTTEEAMEKVRYEWEKKEDAKKRETSTSLASIISSGSSKKFGTSP